MSQIRLTDANYGNDLFVVAEHITAATIVSETTYREGMIPAGVFRRILVYTIGGNQFAVRESHEEVFEAKKLATQLEPSGAGTRTESSPETKGTDKHD